MMTGVLFFLINITSIFNTFVTINSNWVVIKNVVVVVVVVVVIVDDYDDDDDEEEDDNDDDDHNLLLRRWLVWISAIGIPRGRWARPLPSY